MGNGRESERGREGGGLFDVAVTLLMTGRKRKRGTRRTEAGRPDEGKAERPLPPSVSVTKMFGPDKGPKSLYFAPPNNFIDPYGTSATTTMTRSRPSATTNGGESGVYLLTTEGRAEAAEKGYKNVTHVCLRPLEPNDADGDKCGVYFKVGLRNPGGDMYECTSARRHLVTRCRAKHLNPYADPKSNDAGNSSARKANEAKGKKKDSAQVSMAKYLPSSSGVML